MKTLYIFRHGLTQAIVEGRLYGEEIYSANLLPEGKAAIERMAMYLKAIPDSKNYSSQYPRCRQTVAIIENICAKEFIFDKRLGEFQIGMDENQAQFQARIEAFYQNIKLVKNENILICTHGAIIAALLNLSRFGSSEFIESYYPEPGILLIVKGEEVKQIDFN